jgi:hypothetical protein
MTHEDETEDNILTPGLSAGVALEAVPDSPVPGREDVHHVRGPQQSAVDPHAAGLDTEFEPALSPGILSEKPGPGAEVPPVEEVPEPATPEPEQHD